MRVALVLPNPPQYSERFLTHKIRLLQERGFQVMVLVVGVAKSRPRFNYPVYYQPILAPHGPLRWLLSFKLFLIALLTHPQRAMRLIKEAKKLGYSTAGSFRLVVVLSNFLKIQTDWVHFVFGTMAVERALIGKVIQAKVGVSFRGFDICISPLINPSMYEQVWPYVDKVHCISKDIFNSALKVGMPKHMPVSIIYPAIDPESFPDRLPDNENQVPRFLTLSRLHWKKGLEYTLEALSILKKHGMSFHYTIVGSGKEEERLKFATHQLGLEDEVTFLGTVPHEEVPDLMQNHNVYLQYSIQEGFCNAVLEAQAAGMLCIVSDAEGLAENVLHEQTGWVVAKRSPQLLAKTIEKVWNLTDKEQNDIKTMARLRVKNSFSLDKQADAFVAFYQ